MLDREVVEGLGEQAAKQISMVVSGDTLAELLRVYRAWLDAPVGKVESIDMCTDRPTWRVMDNRGMVSLEIGGKQVRLVRDGDSGEGE